MFTNNTRRIQGIEQAGGYYLLVDGDGQILKTADFASFEPIYHGAVRATDVTAQADRIGG